jgi:hypothetical protein
VSFFIFAPDPLRSIAAGLLVVLQALIFLTGNYGFFNLLSILIVVPVFPDVLLQPILGNVEVVKDIKPSALQHILWAGAGILFLLNLLQLASVFIRSNHMFDLLAAVSPFYIVNGYGLFTVMTTIRYEINVEGSDDGVTWKEYVFKWKPVALKTPPKWNMPHQPRLDWQMWFAALSNYNFNPWFMRFLFRLLEGTPDVLSLLKNNPFPNEPPRYVRALLYEYHFTDVKTKRETGEWWKRKLVGLYCPTLSLRE